MTKIRKGLTVDLLEGKPIDDDPEIVEEGKRDHHRPIVAKTSRRIEDKGPIRGSCSKTSRSRLARITSASTLLLLLMCTVPAEHINNFCFYPHEK